MKFITLMEYTVLPLEDDMFDKFVGVLGVGDDSMVDDAGSFDTSTDSSVPIINISSDINCWVTSVA